MSDKVTITTKHPALMPPLLGPHTTVTELEPGESRLITPVPPGVSVMVTAPLPPMLTVRADPLDHGRGTFGLLLEDIGGEPRTRDATDLPETEGGDPEVTELPDAGQLAARLHGTYGSYKDWNDLSAGKQMRWERIAKYVLDNLGPVSEPERASWRTGDLTEVRTRTELPDGGAAEQVTVIEPGGGVTLGPLQPGSVVQVTAPVPSSPLQDDGPQDEPARKLSMQVQGHFDQAAWGANLAGMEQDFLNQLSLMAGVVRQELESREASAESDMADLDRKHEQARLDAAWSEDRLAIAVDRARTLDKPTWLTQDGRPAAAIVSVSDAEMANGVLGMRDVPEIEVPR